MKLLQNSPFPTTQYVDQPRTDAQGAQGELRMLLMADVVYVALISADNQLLACKRVLNAQGMVYEVFLRYILEREPLLHGTYRQVRVYHGSQPFVLLPEAVDRPGDRLLLARLLLDETMLPTELGTSAVSGLRARALFALPRLAESLFAEYRPEGVTHAHLGELIAVQALALAQEHPHFVYVHALPDGMIAAVCHEGRLLLCNRYACRFASDVRYFTQALLSALHVDRPHIPVFLAGEFDAGGKLQQDMKTWFPTLQTPTLLARRVRDVSQPFWRYAVLTA